LTAGRAICAIRNCSQSTIRAQRYAAIRQTRGLTIVNPTAMLETKDPLNCLSVEDGARSKRNFHRPESNCGMALNSGCRVFIVLQPQLRLQIQAPRQSTGSVPQTRKKCSNLGFQESDFSSWHFLKRSKIDILGNLKFFCECLGRSTTTVGCDPCPF